MTLASNRYNTLKVIERQHTYIVVTTLLRAGIGQQPNAPPQQERTLLQLLQHN